MEDIARLRLGGTQALSFAQQRHITMVCGRPVVVPRSSKRPHLSMSRVLSLLPCAEKVLRCLGVALFFASSASPVLDQNCFACFCLRLLLSLVSCKCHMSPHGCQCCNLCRDCGRVSIPAFSEPAAACVHMTPLVTLTHVQPGTHHHAPVGGDGPVRCLLDSGALSAAPSLDLRQVSSS